MRHNSVTLAVLSGMAAVASAQAEVTEVVTEVVTLAYRTMTVTQCYANTGLAPIFNPGLPTPIIHEPGHSGECIGVEIEAPSCGCGCKTCVHINVYTTTLDIFCDSGLCKQGYAVTETFSGMSAKPTIASAGCPYGFTAEVETCTTCGDEPLTATITKPITGWPAVKNVSEPSLVPHGSASNSTASGYTASTGAVTVSTETSIAKETSVTHVTSSAEQHLAPAFGVFISLYLFISAIHVL